MKHSKNNDFRIFGGVQHYKKGGQALGTCPPMTESKRGGQRHRLIGGDSYE